MADSPTDARRVPQPFTGEYSKARTLTVSSASLLALLLTGAIPEGVTLPVFDVDLTRSEDVQWVLAVVVTYGALRAALEWFQAEDARRLRVSSRIDLGLTLVIATVALVALLTVSVDWTSFSVLRTAGILLSAGTGIAAGSIVGLAVWSVPFVRPREEAVRLALPRIPVAVWATFRAAILLTAAITTVFGTWILIAPTAGWYWLGIFFIPFLLVVLSFVLDLLPRRRVRADGSVFSRTDFVSHIRKAFDHHDTLYRIYGGMPARGEHPYLLFTAAERGDLEGVRSQLRAGANPDARLFTGWTPLMIATAQQHEDVVDLLLEEGANPHLHNTLGRTALFFAARYGNTRLVQRFLAAGADPNTRPLPSEMTPLMIASEHGHIAVAERLIDAGADDMQTDTHGRTALEIAYDRGHGAIASLLRRARQRRHLDS
jgi:hypothetical protein